jgi:DNA-binding PucR family transcriptional regulator
MISLFAEHNDPGVFIHPAVFQLQEYDAQYNSDLFYTLKEYLINNQNMSLTANKLHIHYNSLKYRIRKLTELTNLEINRQ